MSFVHLEIREFTVRGSASPLTASGTSGNPGRLSVQDIAVQFATGSVGSRRIAAAIAIGLATPAAFSWRTHLTAPGVSVHLGPPTSLRSRKLSGPISNRCDRRYRPVTGARLGSVFAFPTAPVLYLPGRKRTHAQSDFFVVVFSGHWNRRQQCHADGPFAAENACNSYRNSITLDSFACFSTTAK